MNEILLADRPKFTIAEETRQAERTQGSLNVRGIVMRAAKHALATPIATAEARAVNGPGPELFGGTLKQ